MASVRQKKRKLQERRKQFVNQLHLSIEMQLVCIHGVCTMAFGMLIFLTLGFMIYHSELKATSLEFHYHMQTWNIKITTIYRFSILMYMEIRVFFIELSKKNMHRIADKLNDIMRSTNHITVYNLEQERLHVEGIQNELRAVAVTVNNMLDRLQFAYDKQKQFASDASHELRTPIAVIQGYSNMLDRWGLKDAEVLAESVEAIKNEAQSMKELVEKLLFLSRNDKKTLKLVKEQFDIGEMLKEIIKETRVTTQDRNIEALDVEPIFIWGDRQMIKEAIRVFVENAIKYTNVGDSIYLGCEKQMDRCQLIIADTGIGMEEKDIENIFQRFYRADRVRNHNIDGHGLGLSIAQLIIQKHVGSIKVRSQYGRGTCFFVRLPMQR